MAQDARRNELAEAAAGWAFLHDLFRFPSPEQWSWLHEKRVNLAWQALAGASDEPLPAELPLPGSLEQYREDFIASFEVGVPEPPCPLIESHWNQREPVPRVLHENILFYKQFGLSLKLAANETADHLRHQLEFMHYLCRMEAESPEAELGIALGRRDFLERHLAYWTPKAASKLAEQRPGAWTAHWIALVAGYCRRQSPRGFQGNREEAVSENPHDVPDQPDGQ